MNRNTWLVVIGSMVLIILLGLLFVTTGDNSTSRGFDSWVGKQAPAFSLQDRNGKEVNLSDYRGKDVVLFFNEGVMCYPACWNQIAALGTDSELNNPKVATLSIVNDMPAEWRQVVDKMPEIGKEPVLFDSDSSVSKTYQVLNLPSSMHPGQKAGHTYFLVDVSGVIRWTLDDPQMAVRNKEILQQIKKLGA